MTHTPSIFPLKLQRQSENQRGETELNCIRLLKNKVGWCPYNSDVDLPTDVSFFATWSGRKVKLMYHRPHNEPLRLSLKGNSSADDTGTVCRQKCKTKQASTKFIITLALINMPKYCAQNLFLSLPLSLSVTRNTTKENQKHKQKNNNRDEGTSSSLQSPRRLDTPIRGQALILPTAPNVTMDDRHKLKLSSISAHVINQSRLLLTALSNNAGEPEFETKTENAAKNR